MLKLSLRVQFKDLALVEGAKAIFGLLVAPEGRDPEIYELWTFADDGIFEVNPYARVRISDNFIGDTFHTHFFNAREVRIPFFGCKYVSRSVQWLDVPGPFVENVIANAAWTENIYVNLWGTNPTGITSVHINGRTTFPNVTINLFTVARRAHNNLLQYNCVEQRKTL